jgi:hypothetical protein
MNKAKIFAALLSMSIAGMVHAAEPTAQGLASLGWGCITVSGEVACTPPGEPTVLEVNTMRKKPPAVLVMLFNAVTPAFIGAENLIRPGPASWSRTSSKCWAPAISRAISSRRTQTCKELAASLDRAHPPGCQDDRGRFSCSLSLSRSRPSMMRRAFG